MVGATVLRGACSVVIEFPVPRDEAARLDALRTYNVLDTGQEPEFDELVRLASRVCECPAAAITLVDDQRQWYKARLGLDLPQTPRSADGLCANAIFGREVMVVGDLATDPRFADSPSCQALGFRFYAGAPLVNREDMVLGTLCVLDHKPKALAPDQIESLRVLARQVMAQLELRRLAQMGEFRERLVSILSHDLRQPLQQVLTTARQKLGANPNPQDQMCLTQIAISAERLTRMVRDVLDFTQTRLGNGLPVAPRLMNLHGVCRRVVQEFSLSYPNREIQLELSGEPTGMWDEDRIAQAVSNLLANALRYGSPAKPVTISCSSDDDVATLRVSNDGALIPAEDVPRLFAPYPRMAENGSGENAVSGMGLGLYIVKEIATASGGTVDAISNSDHGTSFRMRLPRRMPLQGDRMRSLLRH